ncbi:MAG: mannose-6-phosphate isomerase, class I [Spirochaetae bacterium HGW-Spirochaetae-1]|nr:MAG: mannose-6-phosphate isomerase, class I [Spirochaetae bacterium HGW-Spirochaetae-1]
MLYHEIHRLANTIQTYSWGSPSFIAELLHIDNMSREPHAELWMGTHPRGPSQVIMEGGPVPLPSLIAEYPHEILGRRVTANFGNALPFLFKILGVERPLSIQVHPDKQQAAAGFSRENNKGVPPDSPERNYHDDNHKPELIYALTPFTALCGFRAPRVIADYLDNIAPHTLREETTILRSGGLKTFYSRLMTLAPERKKEIIDETALNAAKLSREDGACAWICRLSKEYPDDAGILSPVILNLVELKPGQAMYLPAGRLHAYIHGLGIELMANSDNVIRGGLTGKNIDVAELLSIVTFSDTPVEIMEGAADGNEKVFRTGAAEFQLSEINTSIYQSYQSAEIRNVEILLFVEGTVTLESSSTELTASPGDVFLIPALAPPYRITGNCRVFKAAVPL